MAFEIDVNWEEQAGRVHLTSQEEAELIRFNAYNQAADTVDVSTVPESAELTATAEDIIERYTETYGDPQTWSDEIMNQVGYRVAFGIAPAAQLERIGFPDRVEDFNAFNGITPGGVSF